MRMRERESKLVVRCAAGFLWLLSAVAVLAQPQVPQTAGSVVQAEQQPGNDLGAKIASANAALGSARGEIRVTRSGDISTRLTLSPNRDLVCDGNRVTLTLAASAASIVLSSNSAVRGCTISSNQTQGPVGGEVFSQGTSNVQVEGVIFVGGGYHIHFASVSNFLIKNTRHVSITVGGASAILVSQSEHGQIISPRIEGFTLPAGNWQARLIRVSLSHFIDVSDPIIHDVDASAINACGGVTFSSSTNSSLHGGEISGLKNCDGVLTELLSANSPPPSDIEITGTISGGNNNAPGAGKYSHNGEGFDIFNSKNIRLDDVTVRNNDRNRSGQPGIEVSNSTQVAIRNSIISDNGVEGIKVDGSPAVTIENCHTNHNGSAGIFVMPAIGSLSATHGSATVKWAPGRAGITFSAVWQPGTRITIGEGVYTVASLQSTGELTLTKDFAGASGVYGYELDSYVEITGGESLNNGQSSAGLPPNQKAGSREGVYFSGSSGEVTGRVTRLHAADNQISKTQTYGVRVENRGRIVATSNSVEGNLSGGIRDSPRLSEIH
jgi:Right handed beta helix region